MTKRYKTNLKQTLLIGLIATVGFTGCKKYLDVNQNPNNPDSADPTLLLPSTEAAVSQVIGNSFQIYGNIWAQYWTQSPLASQYKSIDQYSPSTTAFDNPWLNLYRGALVNADLITQNNAAGSEYLRSIAYIMKAYAIQVATDAFGDVPLSQALQPSVYGNPKYDAQKSVYDSVFAYIDRGTALAKTASSTSVGIQDMIFQGDMTNWVAFANTLKLRAYLRIFKIDPATATKGIQALYATNPTFLTVDASIKYTNTGGNENPLYNEMASPTLAKTQNLVASSTAVNAFNLNSDPRVSKFYVTAGTGSLVSIPQGSYVANATKKVYVPAPLVGGNPQDATSATAPVKLLSAAESYFLQAEAVARGLATTGSLTDLYQKGITVSFTATGAGDATTYIASAPDALPALTAATTTELKVKAIITQKYYAMCGFQGFEAWTEWRRTGYPTFFVTSAASILGNNSLPMRMRYPNSELTSNSSYPGTIAITVPVWWAGGK